MGELSGGWEMVGGFVSWVAVGELGDGGHR